MLLVVVVLIYSLVGWVPSIIRISLESVSVLKVLPLTPVVVEGVFFVIPWLALSIHFSIKILALESIFIIVVAIAVRIAFLLFLLLLLEQLSLVVLLVVDGLEAGKSLVRCHASLSLQDVNHNAVRALLDSLPSQSCFFGETFLVAQCGFVREVIDTVQELASLPVLAVTLLVVLGAHLGLVVRWQVLLWHELFGGVRVGACTAVLAVAVHDDVAAHLSLFHLLDFLIELEPLLLVYELFLLRRPGGLPSEARYFIEIVLVVVMVVVVVVMVVIVMAFVRMGVIMGAVRDGGVNLLKLHWLHLLLSVV